MHIDWLQCRVIEAVPGKMGGQPVLLGTRVRPGDLLINRDQGIAWLARNHGIDPAVILDVFSFYDAHARGRAAHPA